MANEILLSPGVSVSENDQSQITTGPIVAGLALVGPTVKGTVNSPTLVRSYSEYEAKFGDSFTSASNAYEFLTSQTAYNYFQQGGETVLVTRVTSGSYTPATSSVYNDLSGEAGVKATGSGDLGTVFGSPMPVNTNVSVVLGADLYRFISADRLDLVEDDLDGKVYFYGTGSTQAERTGLFVNKVNEILGTGSAAGAGKFNIWADGSTVISGSAIRPGAEANGWFITDGEPLPYYNADYAIEGYVVVPGDDSVYFTFQGGIGDSTKKSFILETISEGTPQNSAGATGSNGSLVNGTEDNIRWEVTSRDINSGTFSLVVRRGDDTTSNKTVLETFNNLSLDSSQENYIERVIGNTKFVPTQDGTEWYMREVGDYPNNSRYIRVKDVVFPTYRYLDNAGEPKAKYLDYIPLLGSGSFGGATGDDLNYVTNLNENIGRGVDSITQGLYARGDADDTDYYIASKLLANKEAYNFQLLATPGLLSSVHFGIVSDFIAMVECRADSFYIMDLVGYGGSINSPVNEAAKHNTSYAASYWPWLQMASRANGKLVWVPASTLMPGVYAFNDRVAAEWFAPAGLNRGGIGGATRAERRLTTSNRDTLYTNKVNAIATFPGVGLAAYGQKTLQTKASSLDRINVRRLLINLKRYVSGVANTLLFEQNTVVTRNNFLSQVNPYLESVQQKQGLYAYKVVMDETNNTSDVVDRNELVGQIYIQPTKTIEYIYLTFNITPTGVTFE